MSNWNRREWLAGVAGASILGGGAGSAYPAGMRKVSGLESDDCPLALDDFVPKSMLHVPETNIERARFPVIDIHTHISWIRRGDDGQRKVEFLATPEELLRVMDRRNIKVMVNLTGGYGPFLEENIARLARPHPDRFVVFVEPWSSRIQEAGYSKFQGEEIEKAAELGARGLKVTKALGLYLREKVTEGPLIKVDDTRFDQMWEAAGAVGFPVGIHTSDPEAFFLPTDRYNERYEELKNHPDWSFHGKDFPTDRELQEARMRVIRRHPKTNFVALHVANAENLAYVSECLDQCPNMYVEIGARIGELGRQPRASRKFFEEYQDRIIFGTDAVPNGIETPQQIFGDQLYKIYYRFLETADEYFDYAPAEKPPQGRWRIYGLDLPEPILRKVYYENAARLLKL